MGEHHLLLCHLSDPLLNCVSRHEPVDHDSVGLSDTMRPAERLSVRSTHYIIQITKIPSYNALARQHITTII